MRHVIHHLQDHMLHCSAVTLYETFVIDAVFPICLLRLLDQDLHSACLAADPQMDWHRLPFVIEEPGFMSKQAVIEVLPSWKRIVSYIMLIWSSYHVLSMTGWGGAGKSHARVCGSSPEQIEKCFQGFIGRSLHVLSVTAGNGPVSAGRVATEAMVSYILTICVNLIIDVI